MADVVLDRSFSQMKLEPLSSALQATGLSTPAKSSLLWSRNLDDGQAIRSFISEYASKLCSENTPFSTPTPVSGLTTAAFEGIARFSPDELTVYFSGERAPATNRELYVAQRISLTAAFGTAMPLSSLLSTSGDYDPSPSDDGLTIMFSSDRTSGEGLHIYVATRGSILGEFGAPERLANVNSPMVTDDDRQPFLSGDGHSIWFTSNRLGGVSTDDIWRATRSGTGFGMPMLVNELCSTDQDWAATVSSDGLVIYFSSNRPRYDGRVRHLDGASRNSSPTVCAAAAHC